MKTELYPMFDSAKSFYGKAYTIDTQRGITLYSYDRPIITIDENTIIKHWNGYSATTQRHINEFVKQYGAKFDTNKKWFTSLPLDKWVTL